MAKKKQQETEEMTQFSIRLPTDVVSEVDETAEGFFLDRTGFFRLLLAENLEKYKERAKQQRGKCTPKTSSE